MVNSYLLFHVKPTLTVSKATLTVSYDDLYWPRMYRANRLRARAALRGQCEDALKRGLAARERWIANEKEKRDIAERERIEQELKARRERLKRKVVPFQRGTSSSAIPCKE